MAWLALHHGDLTAHVIAHVLHLHRVVRPCDDVAVGTYRGKPERVCVIQVQVNPLLVDLVAP